MFWEMQGQCLNFSWFLLHGEGGTDGEDFPQGPGEGEAPHTHTLSIPSWAVCGLGTTKSLPNPVPAKLPGRGSKCQC